MIVVQSVCLIWVGLPEYEGDLEIALSAGRVLRTDEHAGRHRGEARAFRVIGCQIFIHSFIHQINTHNTVNTA